jgi:hypothetical protein
VGWRESSYVEFVADSSSFYRVSLKFAGVCIGLGMMWIFSGNAGVSSFSH